MGQLGQPCLDSRQVGHSLVLAVGGGSQPGLQAGGPLAQLLDAAGEAGLAGDELGQAGVSRCEAGLGIVQLGGELAQPGFQLADSLGGLGHSLADGDEVAVLCQSREFAVQGGKTGFQCGKSCSRVLQAGLDGIVHAGQLAQAGFGRFITGQQLAAAVGQLLGAFLQRGYALSQIAGTCCAAADPLLNPGESALQLLNTGLQLAGAVYQLVDAIRGLGHLRGGAA
ncbi:hypothetical protein D3C75_855480 [compost metagenome]